MKPNLTLKPRLFRLWTTIGVSLLIGILAIQCQPMQSSGRASNQLAQQASDSNRNQSTDDSQSEDKSNLPAGRKAIALLYEINPWAMVLGSDSPMLALYADGLVIYARPARSGGYEYAYVVLNEQERDALISSLPRKRFRELQPRYETTGATDQKTTILSLWDNNQLKTVSVYGGLNSTDNPRHEGAPSVFIETYEKLKGFQNERAVKWMPEKMELMIWPYDNAGDALPWPKDWPGTKHPETKKRGNGSDQISYSIYLTPAQHETLASMASKKSASALLIDGRKWAFSFRYPFPDEDSWRKK